TGRRTPSLRCPGLRRSPTRILVGGGCREIAYARELTCTSGTNGRRSNDPIPRRPRSLGLRAQRRRGGTSFQGEVHHGRRACRPNARRRRLAFRRACRRNVEGRRLAFAGLALSACLAAWERPSESSPRSARWPCWWL